MIRLIFSLACSFLALFLGGCISDVAAFFYTPPSQQSIADQSVMKRKAEVNFAIDKLNFEGVGAVKIKPVMDIKISVKHDINLLLISTCSRFYSVSQLDKTWFGGTDRTLNYRFKPNNIEIQGLCPMFVAALDDKGVVSWGLLQFSATETLTTRMVCNGEYVTFIGVSTCQTLINTAQILEFSQPIERHSVDENCNIIKLDPYTFVVKPTGVCHGTFLSHGQQIHRTVVIGFETVRLVGEK